MIVSLRLKELIKVHAYIVLMKKILFVQNPLRLIIIRILLLTVIALLDIKSYLDVLKSLFLIVLDKVVPNAHYVS